MITIITWLTYSKIAPQSAKDRHFASSIIKGHSCSTLLMLCLYFLPPRHHLYFLVDILMLLSCSSKNRLKSLWWMQHLSMVISFWKTCHVSLCRFITYLFIEFLELQLGKIFSVIISHFLQLFLSIVWDWKETVFLPNKLITDIQFLSVFHVYSSFLMCLTHQLRHSACQMMYFKYLLN